MGAAVTFKESDLKRAIKVFRDLGMPVRGAEITRDGRIRVLAGDGAVELIPANEESHPPPSSPLEAWERSRGLGDA